MADAMYGFKEGWECVEEAHISNKVVYKITRGDTHHYFWADKNCVFYIEIPYSFNQAEINEIITAIES
jgi:hypothetical protein